MEKRFTIALILSVLLILVVNVWLFPPPPPEPTPEGDEEPGTGAPEIPGGKGEVKPANPKPVMTEEGTKPGEAPVNPPGSVRSVVLENDALAVTFTSLGASVREAILKGEYPDVEGRKKGLDLKILREVQDGVRALRWVDDTIKGSHLDLIAWDVQEFADRLVFTTRRPVPGSDREVEYRKTVALKAGGSHHLEVTFGVRELNPQENTSYQHELRLLASGGVFQEVGQTVGGTPPTSLVFSEDEVDAIPVGETKDGSVSKSLVGDVRYVADTSRYFGAFLVLEEFPQKRVTARVHGLDGDEDQAARGHGANEGEPDAKQDRTYTEVNYRISATGGDWIEQRAVLYLGAVNPADVGKDLESRGKAIASAAKEVYSDRLGFFAWISRLILKLVHIFHGIVGNWGWAIVLMTLTVRLLLFPINRRSQGAMQAHTEAMKKIKPKLDKVKEKYKDDPQKMNQETMKLMRAEGVSMVPLGGCLPMFLQLPIFFGLFSALRAAPDIRLAPWFWVEDLSQPDKLFAFGTAVPNPFSFCCGIFGLEQPPFTHFNLLPLLMAAAMMLNSALMPRPTTADPQADAQRKMMMFMPVFMGVMLYNYAAGLSLYILTSSLLGIVESRVIRKIWPVKGTEAHREKTEGAVAKKG